jgi:DNA-directed RNA polymerase specialized sigma24 family protein
MVEQDQLAKWIVGSAAEEPANESTAKFVAAAESAWPRVLAQTRGELRNQRLSKAEIESLALEIWELVLRSVWKIWRRRENAIKDPENYLTAAFRHRLNRRLKLKRRRDSVLEFLPPEELIQVSSPDVSEVDSEVQIHRGIQLEQIYAMMDERTRKAFIARVYGFKWAEIAKTFEIQEQNLIMRVQYAVRKIRGKLANRTSTSEQLEQRNIADESRPL